MIEHKVDEIIIDGQVEQSYNFIDYWFEDPAGRARARIYLDSPREVSMFPPIAPGVLPAIGQDWASREAMISYFARRFLVIREPGPNGYCVVWMSTRSRRVFQHLGLKLDD